MRWKQIEELLIAKKSNPSATIEIYKILVLGIFWLVLCPSIAGIISLEAATLFIEYEKTKINPSTIILVETFLSLNHCKKIGKGSIRCCFPLLCIWMVSHIEAKIPIFRFCFVVRPKATRATCIKKMGEFFWRWLEGKIARTSTKQF